MVFSSGTLFSYNNLCDSITPLWIAWFVMWKKKCRLKTPEKHHKKCVIFFKNTLCVTPAWGWFLHMVFFSFLLYFPVIFWKNKSCIQMFAIGKYGLWNALQNVRFFFPVLVYFWDPWWFFHNTACSRGSFFCRHFPIGFSMGKKKPEKRH